MKKKSIIIHEDTTALFEGLEDEDAGQLVKAMIAYQNDKETSLSGTLGAVFQMLKIGLDKDNEAYKERCEKNRENIKKRWGSKDCGCETDDTEEYDCIPDDTIVYERITDDTNVYESIPNDTQEEEEEEEDLQVSPIPSKKRARKKFVKPSVDEVRAYCLERGNAIDPECFVDFYESKGWKVGKDGMKDWKAAVRTWEKNRYSNSTQKRPTPQNNAPPKNYVRRFENERKNDYEEMERELRRAQRMKKPGGVP